MTMHVFFFQFCSTNTDTALDPTNKYVYCILVFKECGLTKVCAESNLLHWYLTLSRHELLSIAEI